MSASRSSYRGRIFCIIFMMVESFVKSNYQLIFWVAVLAVAVVLVLWFVFRASSKMKKRKEAGKMLRAERKEMVFELVRGGDGMAEEEIAGFLNIPENEVHGYLVELINEEKIMMGSNVGYITRYKFKK